MQRFTSQKKMKILTFSTRRQNSLNGVLDETTTANTRGRRGRSSRAHARLCKFTSGSRPSSSRRPILRSLICSPQPSTSTACVFSSSISRGTLSNKGTEVQSAAVNILTCQQTFDEDKQKDIDNLRTMFPDKDKSYLSEVRRNNITLNDTIDDILGMEALEVRKLTFRNTTKKSAMVWVT